MISITKIFTFDAAHKLPDYVGKCANLHGHTYKLEVTVTGPLKDGMVVDFGDLKKVVNNVLRHYDHAYLNDLVLNPTAENLLFRLHKEIDYELSISGLPGLLSTLRLWETPTSYAEETYGRE